MLPKERDAFEGCVRPATRHRKCVCHTAEPTAHLSRSQGANGKSGPVSGLPGFKTAHRANAGPDVQLFSWVIREHFPKAGKGPVPSGHGNAALVMRQGDVKLPPLSEEDCVQETGTASMLASRAN
ncbi:unnamed protein product [Lampetra fluviatilis]